MAQCDENYWKDRYQSTWDRSTQREAVLAEYLERKTGRQVEPCGRVPKAPRTLREVPRKMALKRETQTCTWWEPMCILKSQARWKATWGRSSPCGFARISWKTQ